MIDHVNIPVRSLAVSEPFFRDVLAVLGVHRLLQDGPAVGFGVDHWAFGIVETERDFPAMHVAFAAHTRDEVDAFYHRALASGGRSNGAPGLRSAYGPGYYAAYVFDPDGHNIEAVHRSMPDSHAAGASAD